MRFDLMLYMSCVQTSTQMMYLIKVQKLKPHHLAIMEDDVDDFMDTNTSKCW